MEKCGLHNNKSKVNCVLLKKYYPKILIFFESVHLEGCSWSIVAYLSVIFKLSYPKLSAV